MTLAGWQILCVCRRTSARKTFSREERHLRVVGDRSAPTIGEVVVGDPCGSVRAPRLSLMLRNSTGAPNASPTALPADSR
jgi:hypothetical protein